MRKERAALALSLAILTATPIASAQKGPKKNAPAPAAAAPDPAPAPAPAPAATTPPSNAPAASIPPAAPDAVGVGASGEKVEPAASDSTDVTEKPGQTYYFVGLRYGGTVIPKFMLNIFVNEGATIYTNTIGIEVDIRKDNYSFIPSLSYSEYGTGDILFFEKNKPDDAGNYSFVNSSLKALYLGADLLWSAPISKNFDFEYGAGFGLGIIFGDLQNNWVKDDPNGPLVSSAGKHFSPCQLQDVSVIPSCNPAGHSNSTVTKVGGYTEPSWANGGSKPNLFPRILLHLAGLRFKPVKQFEGRLGLGFSITEGFWFGLSGDYGLERPEKKSTGSSSSPVLRWN